MGSSSVFKRVCEDILKPCGVKVGGYKDDIFENLCDIQREKFDCQICYMIAKDVMRCGNGHLFCGACIFAWALTSRENANRCPVCRVCGCYTDDNELSASMRSIAVRCQKCKWRGQLDDYRTHSHGFDDIGADLKIAGLPPIRTLDGSLVFPSVKHSDESTSSVDESRRRHQASYLNLEYQLVEGQARLSFLLDLFEEDLQRHRDNLNTLVHLQRRYNAEQFEEVMRLESELGQITANLLHLIESANHDVTSISTQLRGYHQPSQNQENHASEIQQYDSGTLPASHAADNSLESNLRRTRINQRSYSSRLRLQTNATHQWSEDNTVRNTADVSSFTNEVDPHPGTTESRNRPALHGSENHAVRHTSRLLGRRENSQRLSLAPSSANNTQFSTLSNRAEQNSIPNHANLSLSVYREDNGQGPSLMSRFETLNSAQTDGRLPTDARSTNNEPHDRSQMLSAVPLVTPHPPNQPRLSNGRGNNNPRSSHNPFVITWPPAPRN